MSVTPVTRNIPTVAQAVERFLASRQRQRGVKEYRSILAGTLGLQRTSRRPAGVPLARATFRNERFDKVGGDEFVAWLQQRHPESQAASTFKKGRSALCQLLKFAIANGWANETVLADLPEAPASPPRRDWLRPDQTAALNALVVEPDFTSHQRFMWSCLLNAGLRPAELVGLRREALNPADRSLAVIGKGRGDGKKRQVPVSAAFQAEWEAYATEHSLIPRSWLFPETQVRFMAGALMDHERVTDTRRHCTPKAVRTAVAKVRELAEEAVKQGRMDSSLLPPFALTPKVLRRTYACTNVILSSEMGAGCGLDLRSLQDALGHESLETTAMYLSDVSAYLNRHRETMSVTEAAGMLTAQANGASPPVALAA